MRLLGGHGTDRDPLIIYTSRAHYILHSSLNILPLSFFFPFSLFCSLYNQYIYAPATLALIRKKRRVLFILILKHIKKKKKITHYSKMLMFNLQVNPDAQDRTSQQIQSKLGNYSLVKHLLEEPKRLFGIEGVPASPAPSPSPSSRLTVTAANNPRVSPSTQEFKKPGSGPRSSSSSSSSGSTSAASNHSSQRGGFVKPTDGKPPYGGRGGYPGQPVKHGGNSNDHRSHGIMPAKGPPPNSSSNVVNSASASRLNSAGSRLPRLPMDNVSVLLFYLFDFN